MAKKRNDYYFDSFYKLVDYPTLGAKTLAKIIDDINALDTHLQLLEVHDIEHQGDLAKYDVTKKLADEFITPIEREDIAMLLSQIDDIMDTIEDIVRLLSMYNVKKIRDEAKEFTPIIMESCDVIQKMLEEFKNFHRSKTIKDYFLKINELEEKADIVHYEAIRRLFKESNDPIEIFTWTNIFDAFENCCDQFKEVSELVEMIILKNT